jgi:signal transduction histidine kinase/CheY-like chemotaxis protein
VANRSPLRIRLMLTFLGLGVGPLLLAAVLLGWHGYQAFTAENLARQQELARRVGAQFIAFLGPLEAKVQGINRHFHFAALDRARQREVLEQLVADRRYFRQVSYWRDAEAPALRLSNMRLLDEAAPPDPGAQSLVRTILERGELAYGAVHFEPESGEPLLELGIPVGDSRNGRREGVILVQLRIKSVWALVAGLDLAPGEEVHILDEAGRVIADHNPSLVLRGASQQPVTGGGPAMGLHGSRVFMVTHDLELGQRRFTVVAERAVAEALRPALESLEILAAVLLGSLAVALLLFLRAVCRVVQPIRAVAEAAHAIRDGDLDHRVAIAGDDELGDLATAFNGMTSRLRGSLEALKAEVAERRHQQQAREESEARFRALFENSPVSLWEEDFSQVKTYLEGLREAIGETDPAAFLESHPEQVAACSGLVRVLDINQATLELHGAREREELLGNLDRTFTPDSLAAFRRELAAVLRGDLRVRTEGVVKTLAGEPRHVVVYWEVAPGFEDSLARVLVALLDITPSKEAELALRRYQQGLEDLVQARTAELERAKAAAEAANHAKSLFLANMSHELRTPLNAILGFAQVMQGDDNLSPHQRENLAIINSSGAHLLGMINEVLDISKIEAGKVQLEPEAFDLPRTLGEIGEMIRSRAKGKGLAFRLELAPGLESGVRADLGKLRQVLINLLGNAIKFTARGEVVLRARTLRRGPGEQDGWLELEVEDSGPGIPPDQAEAIFAPFFQLGTEAGEQKGTGLGLAISRSFMELMGGEIRVRSEPGRGACFVVGCPVAWATASELPAPGSSSVQPVGLAPGQPEVRLLVVEDDEHNRRLIRTLLERIGLSFREAANGEEAIRLFQEWSPHLIWMDIRMPVLDGFEATRRIRALPGGREVKIIALTASVFRDYEHKILLAGCDGIVHKPYQPGEIYQALEEFLGLRLLRPEPAAPDRTAVTGGAPGALAGLPATCLEGLRDAALSLDREAIQARIAAIAAQFPEAAGVLAALAGEFCYDKILSLCEQVLQDRQSR